MGKKALQSADQEENPALWLLNLLQEACASNPNVRLVMNPGPPRSSSAFQEQARGTPSFEELLARHQSTSGGGSSSAAAAAGGSSSASSSGQTAVAFAPGSPLTVEDLQRMMPSDKVTVDMSSVLDQKCEIFTTAGILYGSTQSTIQEAQVFGRKMALENLGKVTALIRRFDPQKLYLDMNRGEKDALLKWQQYSVCCMACVQMRYHLFGVPMSITVYDNTAVPPAKQAAQNRATITYMTPEMQSMSLLASVPTAASNPSTIKGKGAGRRRRQQDANKNDQGTHNVKPFSEEELGDVEHLLVDVSHLVGHPLKIQIPRAQLLSMLASNLCNTTDAQLKALAEKRYQVLSARFSDPNEVKKYGAPDDVVLLAALARVLYGIPLIMREAVDIPLTRDMKGNVVEEAP